MLQKSKKTPRRLKTSIKRDAVHPADYLKYDFRSACEDCTHFKASNTSCTLGYGTSWHLEAFQAQEYERTGKMALCRFLEID